MTEHERITKNNLGVSSGLEKNSKKLEKNFGELDCISRADARKALKEGSKDISENVLAIVREEYISKADYETRLKADMVAMLSEIQLDIEKHKMTSGVTNQGTWNECIACCSRIIQQKINLLKAENEPQESEDNNGTQT